MGRRVSSGLRAAALSLQCGPMPAVPGREVIVLDVALLAATAAFFLLGLAFVRACDRL